MLWSWYADDDFRFLKGNDVGVAYLALSLDLQGKDEVVPNPRTSMMRADPDSYQMAVVRIDSNPNRGRPSFSDSQRRLVVQMIGEIRQLAHPRAVQIDFDAPKSAWPFYRRLLEDLRKNLGPDVFLSITALVSWCDLPASWMASLPVDEIVPMAFSMGQATAATITMLTFGGQFGFAGCRSSLGTELQTRAEPWMVAFFHPRSNQRAYIFPGATPWTPALVEQAKRQIQP